MADNKSCTVRTRKFMTNRLLARKQFVSSPLFLLLLLRFPPPFASFVCMYHWPLAQCARLPGLFKSGVTCYEPGRGSDQWRERGFFIFLKHLDLLGFMVDVFLPPDLCVMKVECTLGKLLLDTLLTSILRKSTLQKRTLARTSAACLARIPAWLEP